MSSAHAKRQDAASCKNEPEPSQRSIDSLGAVCPFTNHAWSYRSYLISTADQFCRKRCNVPTCCTRCLVPCLRYELRVDVRSKSICRYFGEIIDTTDDDVMESVCDKMCDVRPLPSTAYSVRDVFIQVCKFPDKTRQRKTNLSEEDHAAAVISRSAWNAGYEDDDVPEGRKPLQQPRAPVSAGARTNPGQKTLWDCLDSVPVQGFKRPNANGRDKLNSKKAKVVHTMDERIATGTSSTRGSSTSTRSSMPPPLSTSPLSLRRHD